MKTFYIHDNYSKPFMVTIDNKLVKVYKYNFDADDYGRGPVLEVKADNIFIGKSPRNKMTEYSEGFGENFDGNTILVNVGNSYIFIGRVMKMFKALSKITKFISPVGNSDIPYPYAIDTKGNYYLFNENVILTKMDKGYKDGPYDYYYDTRLITKNTVFNKAPLINFENITEYYIDGDNYTLSYKNNPEQNYENITREGQELTIRKNGKIQKLDKKKYVNLIKRFGKKMGFKPIV